MNILFLNHNIAWTGGFFRAYHWGRHLRKKGHSVTIVTISERDKLRFTKTTKDGVLIIKSPDLLQGRLRTGWDPWDTIARLVFLKQARYDIVHCVDTRPNVVLPGLFLKYKRHAKLVMDWGDWWGRGGTIKERSVSALETMFAPIETFFEERFRRYADGHVVLSEALRQRVIALGAQEETVVRIPHGADIGSVVPRDKLRARSRLGIDERRRIIGYLGTIFPADAELLTRAFEIACTQIKDINLFIIGNCKVKFPDNLVEQGKIVETGRVDFDTMLDYLAACDLMVLPLKNSIANRGRWPSKVCDYLAAGKPVVSTDVSDTSLLFANGSGGGCLTHDTPKDFAEGISRMLQSDCLDYHEKKARAIAEQELSWEILSDRLEGFYETISRK